MNSALIRVEERHGLPALVWGGFAPGEKVLTLDSAAGYAFNLATNCRVARQRGRRLNLSAELNLPGPERWYPAEEAAAIASDLFEQHLECAFRLCEPDEPILVRFAE